MNYKQLLKKILPQEDINNISGEVLWQKNMGGNILPPTAIFIFNDKFAKISVINMDKSIKLKSNLQVEWECLNDEIILRKFMLNGKDQIKVLPTSLLNEKILENFFSMLKQLNVNPIYSYSKSDQLKISDTM